jgi:hypothetical protein
MNAEEPTVTRSTIYKPIIPDMKNHAQRVNLSKMLLLLGSAQIVGV